MKQFLMIAGLICLSSCATKLRVPLNRMMSPETVGGAMNTEFELSSKQQVEGKVDVSQAEPYPLRFTSQAAMGYFAALSLLDSVDITWTHTASAPSLLGFKWQFMGGSLQQAGAGNSMAISAAFGGNEHEIDGNPKVEFETAATDVALIHGYWLTPNWQIFETLGYASYSYKGELSGSTSGEFGEDGTLLTVAGGTALVFRPYKLKFEAAYTQADWSEAGNKTYLSFAFGLGLFF
jgi:hypothetical protein